MAYTLKELLNDKKLRGTVVEQEFVFQDNNGIFQLDFQKRSMLKNHRETFDRLCALGGEALLAQLLAEGKTCLTDDPNAAKQGVRPIQGTQRFYLKTNAGALTALTSIFFGIAGWAELDKNFDMDNVMIRPSGEETPTSEPQVTQPCDTKIPLFEAGGAMLSPINGSIIQKDGEYSVYDNERKQIIVLPMTYGEGLLSVMAVCERVDPEHEEFGWKYKQASEDSVWGWIHPQFRQIIAPKFNEFRRLSEDSAAELIAMERGKSFHDYLSIWVFHPSEKGTVRLDPLRMPSNPLYRDEDGTATGYFNFITYPMLDITYRLLYEQRIWEGEPRLCILMGCKTAHDGTPFIGEQYIYWELSAEKTFPYQDFSEDREAPRIIFGQGGGETYGSISYSHYSAHVCRRRYAFGVPQLPTLEFFRYMRDYEGSNVERTLIAVPTNEGRQMESLHVVERQDEPKLYALAKESSNGRSYDRWTILTPFAFTDVRLLHRRNMEDRDTPELYLRVEQFGKVGMVKVSAYSWLSDISYFLPCEYDDIGIFKEEIRVRRLDCEGKLNLEGRWIEPLHKKER